MGNQRHIYEAPGRAKAFALMNDTISRNSLYVPSREQTQQGLTMI